jgi:K+-transporting ATPase ATPase C chain
VIGSALIAQAFAKAEYLHPRPSAAGNGYDPTSSGGSNYGPLTPRSPSGSPATPMRCASRPAIQEIPDDAITTSASGLDPDISPAYATCRPTASPRRAAPRPTSCRR